MEDLLQKGKERFPYLSEEKLIEIISMGELVVLKAGEIFEEAGSRSGKAAVVIEGMLRNYIINDKGKQITVVFATEMQALAPYQSALLFEPASETTEAVTDCILLVFSLQKVREKAHEDIEYARIYTDLIEKSLLGAVERVEDLIKRRPEQRYQRLLDMHGYLIEQVPLKYLASYLGVNAVSLSRIRKRVARPVKRDSTGED